MTRLALLPEPAALLAAAGYFGAYRVYRSMELSLSKSRRREAKVQWTGEKGARLAARSRASCVTRLAASGRVALLCIGAMLAFAAEPAAAGVSRGALWKVVEACLISHALTGGAFPCLQVNVSGGRERGYVVLRPPLSGSNLILAPTRRIAGVEDASLEASDAPNYFENAWRARKFLDGMAQKPLPHDGVVLAVNSRPSRTQDQLHIHIGCLSSSARRAVQAFATASPVDRWVPLGRSFHGLEFRARLLVLSWTPDLGPLAKV
jgi:CDP-diacylglycerol pyrophosphatase